MNSLFTLFPFTFSYHVALSFARRAAKWKNDGGVLYTCLVDRRFIAVDVDLFQFSFAEDEVLVYPEGLLDCYEELIAER